MQDPDERAGTGAFRGEVNATVHRGLNTAGAVCIPPHCLNDLPRCIEPVRRREASLFSSSRRTDFILASLKQAIRATQDIH
jgi:hypothetical protein